MSATIQPAETRRLATILSIDIAGFSRASEVDDVAAARHVRGLRLLCEAGATAHGGRVFNTAGDGLMLEFPTIASGVAGALDIADAVRADISLPRIRMGLHVGDVTVLANGDLIGAGVNVAARVQQRAAPGEILTTGEVRNLAGGQAQATFTDYGVAPLDKMARQVSLFALARPGVIVRQGALSWMKAHRLRLHAATAVLFLALIGGGYWIISTTATSRPSDTAVAARSDIPIVAVLPFANLSGDPKLQYFSDGMTEEIQDTLSRIQGIRVISRTSSFVAGDSGQDTRAVAKALNATHVLTGSVRSNGATLRISAQLLLGDSGAIVWNETFERPTSETLAVQDEIATRVARALKVVAPQTQRTPSMDPKAVELYLKGRDAWRTGGDLSSPPELAISSLEEAVRLAPDFARAWAALASAYAQRQNWCVGDEQQLYIDKALDAANRAVSLDPNLGEPYVVLGRFDPSSDLAVRETWYEKALQAEPNDDDTQMLYAGFWLAETGRIMEARRMLAAVYEIDPLSDLLTSRYADLLAETGDVTALERMLAPVAGRSHAMDAIWQKVFMLKLVAHDFAGAHIAKEKLEAALAALPKDIPLNKLDQFHAVLNDMMAAFENNDSAARDRLVKQIQEGLSEGQASAIGSMLNAALIGRNDLAFDIARQLYIDHAYQAGTVSPEEIPAAYPYGRVPAGPLLGYYAKAMQSDPAIWSIFAATGHAQYWLQSGKWPDFCKRADLGYDCKVEAEKAIGAQKVN